MYKEQIYSTFTHASCMRMMAVAMKTLSEGLLEDSKTVCSLEEIKLLRDVVEMMGSDENRALINQDRSKV